MSFMEPRIGELEARLQDRLRDLDAALSRLAAVEQLANKMGGGGFMGGGGASKFWIGKATSSITARSGSTPGSGTVEIYNAASGTLTATGTTKSVKNAGTAISSGKHVRIDQDGFDVWWASPEECE